MGWLSLAVLFLVVSCRAQNASFPGRTAKLRSPDGRYVIENVDYDERDPAHGLFLVDTKTRAKIKIQGYARGVDVLWSPESEAFVVNDHEGSDSTRPLLYSLPWTGSKTDLLEELTVFMRARHQEGQMHRDDHSYLTVRRWMNSRDLLCKLEAYGNRRTFEGSYLYTIGEGFHVYDPKDQNK